MSQKKSKNKLALILGLLLPLIIVSFYFFRPEKVSYSSLREKADHHIRQKEYVPAIETYLKILDQYPRHDSIIEVLMIIGDTYHYSMNNLEKASKAYRMIVKKYPRSPDAKNSLVKLGELFSKKGDFEQSLLAYQDLIDKFPTLPNLDEYRFQVAMKMMKLKKHEPARRKFMQLFDLNPLGPFADKALFQIGLSFFIEGNCKQSLEVFNTFLPKYKDSSELTIEARFLKASCLEELAKYPDALQQYRKIRKKYPNPRVIEDKIDSLTQKIKERNRVKIEALKQELSEEEKKVLRKKAKEKDKKKMQYVEPQKDL